MGYRIRPTVPADLADVLALLQPFVERRMIIRRSRSETEALLPTGFAAVFDSRLVGFASVEIYSKKLAEIQCLGVLADHRRHGIGGHLVTACIELARQRGIMEVMAISSSDHFLQKLGFDYSLPDQKRALFFQLRSRESIFTNRDDSVGESHEDCL